VLRSSRIVVEVLVRGRYPPGGFTSLSRGRGLEVCRGETDAVRLRALAVVAWIVLGACCVWADGLTVEALVNTLGCAVVVALTVIDIERRIVPNRIVVPALVVALVVQTIRDPSPEWIVSALGPDVPVHFTAFHPDFKMRDRPPTPPETLTRARRIALDNGVRYAYTGNVHDPAGQSTRCHECGALLIERDWYRLGAWQLTGDGRCVSCDTPLAGVFHGPPGTWGPRRLPVRIANQ